MARKNDHRARKSGVGKSDKKRGERREAEPKFTIDFNPKIRRDATAILLAVLAIISFLAVFVGGAGMVGSYLNGLLAAFFGLGRFAAPFAFAYLAVRCAFPERFQAPVLAKIGALLFTAASLAFLNLLRCPSPEAMLYTDNLSRAGGYLGLALGYPAISWLGFWAGIIVVAAILILSLAITFNSSLEELADRLNLLRWVRLPGDAWTRSREGNDPALTSGFEKRDLTAAPSAPTASSAELTDEKIGDFPGDDSAASPDKAKPKRRPRRLAAIPADLLELRHSRPGGGDIQARQFTIKKTLENFGIPVEMGELSVGPTVTQYTLKPADGIKLSRITGLSNDLALSLAAHPIRIEAPIPGKSLVGIEVPNQSIAIVSLRDIVESREFKERASSLTFCLGKDVAGKPWVADLGRMPHLLVAGATGSGKTVCLNSIIVSLLFANSPEDLRLILVDPKRVELPIYNGIPHLLCPAITEVPKIINALKWAIGEMDRRFEILSKSGKRDIGSYNESAAEKLPYIVVIIDELADLMVASAAEVEAAIIRLAQMSRAVGIHLIVATQRPSVDVITGLIKANITARIAFSVASATDSRTILDTTGAEKLVGRGDSLFLTAELSKPKRIQCCYVADREIRQVVNFITSQLEEPVEYNDAVTEKHSGLGGSSLADGDDDELLDEAKDTVIRAGKASASYLQRRLKIGYARAARLLDLLEERGIIGPGDGAKPREVLVSAIHDVDGVHVPDVDDEGEDAG